MTSFNKFYKNASCVFVLLYCLCLPSLAWSQANAFIHFINQIFKTNSEKPENKGKATENPNQFYTPNLPPTQIPLLTPSKAELTWVDPYLVDPENYYPAARWGNFGVMGYDNLHGARHSKYKTSSNNYVKIKRLGTQYYVQENASQLVIQLSALAEVQQLGSLLKIRALVDGHPTNEVMFASGTQRLATTAQFIAYNISKGAHDIQFEFSVMGGGEASIADPSLFIQSGKSDSKRQAMNSLYSSVYSEFRGSEWKDVGNELQLSSGADEKIHISLGFETANTEAQGLQVRVLVDEEAVHPSQMLLTGAPYVAARAVTFSTNDLRAGNHRIRLQARSWGGVGKIYAYSMVATAVKYVAKLENNAFQFSEDAIENREVSEEWSTIPGMSHDMRLAPNVQIAGVINLELAALPLAAPIYIRMKVAAGNGEGEVISMPEHRNVGNDSPKFGSLSLFYFVKGINLSDQEKRRVVSFEWRTHEDAVLRAGGPIQVPLGKRSMVLRSQSGNFPDITGGIQMISYPEPARGNYNVLTVVASRNMLAPQAYQLNDSGITSNHIRDQLFGEHSMRDYFDEMSEGKTRLVDAGVLGPYRPAYPDLDAACRDRNTGEEIAWDGKDACDSSCSKGHVSRGRRAWIQLLQQANADFNFADYDFNKDGEIDPNTELAILIVEPTDGNGGAARALTYCANNPAGEEVIFDGVKLQQATNWGIRASGLRKNEFIVAAHELGHQIWDFTDVYSSVNHNYNPGFLSLMSFSSPTSYLDGVHALMQGLSSPQLVSESGDYTLDGVNQGGSALILPRLDGKSAEFFLLENRQDAGAAARGIYDEGIRDSGIAIWHFIDNYALNSSALRDAMPRCYTNAFWDNVTPDARRRLRLLYPGLLNNAADALWDQSHGEVLDNGNVADCGTAGGRGVAAIPGTQLLQWADGTASGYNIRFTSASADRMTLNIQINRRK